MKAIPALALNERANAASHTLPPLLVDAGCYAGAPVEVRSQIRRNAV